MDSLFMERWGVTGTSFWMTRKLPDREMRVIVTVLEPAIEAPAAESDGHGAFQSFPTPNGPPKCP